MFSSTITVTAIIASICFCVMLLCPDQLSKGACAREFKVCF